MEELENRKILEGGSLGEETITDIEKSFIHKSETFNLKISSAYYKHNDSHPSRRTKNVFFFYSEDQR